MADKKDDSDTAEIKHQSEDENHPEQSSLRLLQYLLANGCSTPKPMNLADGSTRNQKPPPALKHVRRYLYVQPSEQIFPATRAAQVPAQVRPEPFVNSSLD